MLNKEVSRIKLLLDNPYIFQLSKLKKGQYFLKIIHKSDYVFNAPRSIFFSFSIPEENPKTVAKLLGLKDISSNYGVFGYVGGGNKVGDFYTQSLTLDVEKDIPVLEISLRIFAIDIEVYIEALQIYDVAVPETYLFGTKVNELFFVKHNVTNIDFLDQEKKYSQKENTVLIEKLLIKNELPQKICIENIEEGSYLLQIHHQNKAAFERDKSLFVNFLIPEMTSDDIQEILELKFISEKYGVFSYFNEKSITESNGYQQEILLNITQDLSMLEIGLNSFLSADVIVEEFFLTKLPEVEKNIASASLPTKQYCQYWESHIEDSDLFRFQNFFCQDISESIILTREGCKFSLNVDELENLILRFKLEAAETIYAEKQAILTIDYLDENGDSLVSVLDTPYSSSLKKYYHYLTVDPNFNNNLLFEFPKGTTTVELGIQSWDNQTNIVFDGSYQIATHKSGVSIVIPSYKGERTIVRCLDSLRLQTLEQSKFEVIIALNGERDSTRHIIDEYIALYPQLNITVLELDIAGASHARNSAIKQAIFSHITFVDDDDYIAKDYLLTLFEKSAWNTVTLTGVKDVFEDTKRIRRSTILDQLVKASVKDIIVYNDVTSILTMNACKMAPTHMIKSIDYNETLKSGEDVVYWTRLLSKFAPIINVANKLDKAVYYRVITDNSVSRQQESYEFNVLQRLEVILDLVKIQEQYKTVINDVNFIQSKINSQANFIRNFLVKNPSYYDKFRQEIISRNINNKFIHTINEKFTKRLVISYCFAPYADTSAVVMSKRINKMELPVDVISNSMSNVRTKDESLNKIASFNIGKHIELNAPQSFSNWDAIVKFSEMVVREMGNIISQRTVYEEVYSRAMWPASHFAAALVKIKYPHIKWIAEFSDPLLKDVTGKDRYEKSSLEWFKNHGLISEKDTIDNDNLFYWCEQLVYDWADEIIFTNENQKSYMHSYANSELFSLGNKSMILSQPTLNEEYYNISNLKLDKKEDYIYIGYFGSFYVNRGFDMFFAAWDNLSPALKKKIRLHIYTQQDKELILEKAPVEVREYIEVSPYVGYLDFLSLSKQFDILLVVDAKTEGLKINNPYLPSKMSDYLGSDNTILAFVEENSPMSMIDSINLYKVKLNNLDEITSFLEGYGI